MPAYVSIKEDVLRKLSEHFPELRERFGLETIGIFGSVASGEDTPDSDIDILYAYQEGKQGGMKEYFAVIEYLEELLGRKIDFVPITYMQPYFRTSIEPSMILFGKVPEVTA
ncbi:nucleotidyltransferase family protein [Methanocorpusculum sp. MG]|uniref:protein adenylyltransferase n=1 Tax=Methanocorpusculum petauri TaxID=3002863 RepID=A0ABT4IFM4_9EURY|nr:nucleotidyltransferase family protein [Methanocorpusculum petauri]MCZ0860179.1 nucleotidyltransferase family protein [Methanocorpusculum petauri]MCZ9313353.1 nucleotidyltransferase family protein [Methanocorpusculum sp.]MDE2443966.1 nucleotidyltransferase family protein [Methanocorpusculum sp.]